MFSIKQLNLWASGLRWDQISMSCMYPFPYRVLQSFPSLHLNNEFMTHTSECPIPYGISLLIRACSGRAPLWPPFSPPCRSPSSGPSIGTPRTRPTSPASEVSSEPHGIFFMLTTPVPQNIPPPDHSCLLPEGIFLLWTNRRRRVP